LKEGEYLVNKNKIITDNKGINTSEVSDVIKQKPNRKILSLFRFHLGVYNYAMLGKTQSKTDSFLIRAIGEPPVILDTILTEKSVKQIKLYLNSKGYFNSTVEHRIDYKKRKKANISYFLKTGNPYTINSVEYDLADANIAPIILKDTLNSLVKKGDNYDESVFQQERDRIEIKMKNEGYYGFSRELIKFRIDSTLGKNMLDVMIEIKNPTYPVPGYKDSTLQSPHKKYYYNKIRIYTDFNSLVVDTSLYKQLSFTANKGIRKKKETVYDFYYMDKLKIKPKALTQAILLKKGDLFELKNVEISYNNLMNLKVYKFVNIQFDDAGKDSVTNLYWLNTRIYLTPTPKQFYSIETEATNSSGNLGIAGNLLYQNKNIFKGAEIFNFKIKGAMEVQKILGEKTNETGINTILPFNTIETGAEVGIDIPRFLLPVNMERFPKSFRPNTIIKTGVQYQKRTDYTRYIINYTYGYEFKRNTRNKYTIYLADVNSVKIYPDSLFQEKIDAIKDPKIRNSYNDHLTLSGRFSYLYNNQLINKPRNFYYLKYDFETSGFIMRRINKLLNNYKYADGSYTLFNLSYAQYVKSSIEFRRYLIFPKDNKVVFRGLIGAGTAYGNSSVFPFEKSYFSGGANSVRAWKIYSLGPGGYSDTTNTNIHVGDINLEGNVEYRFPIYSYLNGALFIDAGNVWLNKENFYVPNGEFRFDRFYKEIAMGAGFGARFDFSFFVLRLDAAIALRDPSKTEGNRWGVGKKINLNLGIGYPF
jgi:outer membrane protein assembly factor BamA